MYNNKKFESLGNEDKNIKNNNDSLKKWDKHLNILKIFIYST